MDDILVCSQQHFQHSHIESCKLFSDRYGELYNFRRGYTDDSSIYVCHLIHYQAKNLRTALAMVALQAV